jgi:hypothetical protein
MTDAQFDRIKKGLKFYSENGVNNLCTLTETSLRGIIEFAIKDQTEELKALRGSLKDYGAGCYENGLRNGRNAAQKDIERQSELLEKATELLRKWVELYKPKLEGYPITPIQEQTEQFLIEVKK